MLRDMVNTLLPQMVAFPYPTELVIVDDGSTDSTAEFLADLQQQLPPLATLLWSMRVASGSPAAMMISLLICNG